MPTSPAFSKPLYAAALHGDQGLKFAGGPYLADLLAVAATVLEHGGNEDEAVAALLHDAVEDQGGLATRRRFAAGLAIPWHGLSTAAPMRPRVPSRRGGREKRPISPACRGIAFRPAGLGRRQAAQHPLHSPRVPAPGESIWGLFAAVARARSGTIARSSSRSSSVAATPWSKTLSVP